MFKACTLTLIALIFSIVAYGQPGLIIAKNIKLPADSVSGKLLITSLQGFLKQSVGPNAENTFVQLADLPEASALLDEMKGMENGAGADNKNQYKCYLTNVVLLAANQYVIQLSYLGNTADGPVLRASFKLVALQKGTQFYFSSPLKLNSATWRVKQQGNFSFYFNTPFNDAKVSAYIKTAHEFDVKLKAPNYVTRIYLCGNLHDELNLLGVEYKMDYNGLSQANLSAFENMVNLNLIGGDPGEPSVLDLHDLWHARLHHVVSTTVINKPVDEACAYLYGGSWGIPWPQIFKSFKLFMGSNHDWLSAFTDNKNFGTSQRYHLYVSYVINALIVQQIEKEKGFDGVKQLLSCGKKQLDNQNYFNALAQITGISKSNFNQRVEELVVAEAAK